MALFRSDQGEIFEVPDNYDEQGNNLARDRAAKSGLHEQVFQMQEKPGSEAFYVPQHKVKDYLSQGWQTPEQHRLLADAAKTEESVRSGKYLKNYNQEHRIPAPSGDESQLVGENAGFTWSGAPILSGAREAIEQIPAAIKERDPASVLNHYRQGRDVAEGNQGYQEMTNPVRYNIGKVIGGAASGAGLANAAKQGLVGAAEAAPGLISKLGDTFKSGALYGGVEGALSSKADLTKPSAQAFNQELGDINQNTITGGTGATLFHGAVQGAGEVGNFLGRVGKKIIGYTPTAKEARVLGKEGVSLQTPEERRAAVDAALNIPEQIKNKMSVIKNTAGAGKGELIEKSEPISHAPLLQKIEETIEQLRPQRVYDISKFTKSRSPQDVNAFDDLRKEIEGALDTIEANPNNTKEAAIIAQQSIDRISKSLKGTSAIASTVAENLSDQLKKVKNPALVYKVLERTANDFQNTSFVGNKTPFSVGQAPADLGALKKLRQELVGSRNTLLNSPDDAYAIDRVKQQLQDIAYNSDLKNHALSKKTAAGIANLAKTTLENNIDKIKDKNLAWQLLNNAEGASNNKSPIPTAGEIASLGRKHSDLQASAEAQNTLKNLKNLRDEIMNEPGISDVSKNQFDQFINSVVPSARKAQLAKEIDNASHSTKIFPEENAIKWANGLGLKQKELGEWINKIPFSEERAKFVKKIYEHPQWAKIMDNNYDFARRLIPQLGTEAGIKGVDFAENRKARNNP